MRFTKSQIHEAHFHIEEITKKQPKAFNICQKSFLREKPSKSFELNNSFSLRRELSREHPYICMSAKKWTVVTSYVNIEAFKKLLKAQYWLHTSTNLGFSFRRKVKHMDAPIERQPPRRIYRVKNSPSINQELFSFTKVSCFLLFPKLFLFVLLKRIFHRRNLYSTFQWFHLSQHEWISSSLYLAKPELMASRMTPRKVSFLWN